MNSIWRNGDDKYSPVREALSHWGDVFLGGLFLGKILCPRLEPVPASLGQFVFHHAMVSFSTTHAINPTIRLSL